MVDNPRPFGSQLSTDWHIIINQTADNYQPLNPLASKIQQKGRNYSPERLYFIVSHVFSLTHTKIFSSTSSY